MDPIMVILDFFLKAQATRTADETVLRVSDKSTIVVLKYVCLNNPVLPPFVIILFGVEANLVESKPH